MKLWLRRKDVSLVPYNRVSELLLFDLPFGAEFRAELTQPRSGWMHRLYWSFATYVAKTLNEGPGDGRWTPEEVVANFKRACGHVEYFRISERERVRNGLETDLVMREKSIAYEAMDQLEFGPLFDETLVYVKVHLCPQLMDGPYKREIEKIIAKFGRLSVEQIVA